MKYFTYLLIVLTLFVCCTPEPTPPAEEPGDPVIYVAGYYNDGSNDIACYWKDGVKVEYSDVPSRAFSIYVDNDDVYTSGYYTDDMYACYWKNGTITELNNNISSFARSIVVHNGNVYVSGDYSFNLNFYVCYWLNGTEIELESTSSGSTAGNSIFILNDTVYVAGSFHNGSVFEAAYWENGTRNTLDSPSTTATDATAIYCKGSDVYIAGEYHNGENQVASYWDNGTLYDLPETDVPNVTRSIFVDENDDVYISGHFLDGASYACFWKNGTRTVLSNDYSEAHSIIVQNGSVYIAGIIFDGTTIYAGYWKDGVFIECESSTSPIWADDIFIVPWLSFDNITDIHDPANPISLSRWEFPASIYNIFATGDYALVTFQTKQAELLDISDPGNLISLGMLSNSENASGVSIDNSAIIFGSNAKTLESHAHYIARCPRSLEKIKYESFHSKVLFKTLKCNDFA